MVFPDPSEGQRSSTNTLSQRSYSLAAPSDRLAAHVIDAACVAPVISLILSYWRRGGTEALLLGDQVAFADSFLSMTLAAMFLILVYLAGSWQFWGQTLGQRYMQLRVVSIWGNRRLSWRMSWLRSLVWILEWFLFAIPFLAVLSYRRRRPLHDRIADSLVVTLPHRSAGEPSRQELLLAKAGTQFLVGFSALVMASAWLLHRDSVPLLPGQAAAYDCSVIEKASERDSFSELAVAMTYYAAGSLSQECLDLAANEAARSEEQKGLVLLAKSFAWSERRDLSDKYLAKVCQVDQGSQACLLSEIIYLMNEKRWPLVSQKLSSASSADLAPFVRIWAVRHMSHFHLPETGLSHLQALPKWRHLSEFLSTYRTKLLWKKGKEELSKISYEAAVENIEGTGKTELQEWMCFHQLEDGCQQALPTSCVGLNQHAKEKDFRPLRFLTQVHTAECRQKLNQKPEWGPLKKIASKTPSLAFYVEAVEQIAKGNKEQARESLKKMTTALEGNTFPAIEVAHWQRVLDLSTDMATVEQAYTYWEGLDVTEEDWLALARKIIDRALDHHSWQTVAKLTQRMSAKLPWELADSRQFLTQLNLQSSSRQRLNALWSQALQGRQTTSQRLPASAVEVKEKDTLQEGNSKDHLEGKSQTEATKFDGHGAAL